MIGADTIGMAPCIGYVRGRDTIGRAPPLLSRYYSFPADAILPLLWGNHTKYLCIKYPCIQYLCTSASSNYVQ